MLRLCRIWFESIRIYCDGTNPKSYLSSWVTKWVFWCIVVIFKCADNIAKLHSNMSTHATAACKWQNDEQRTWSETIYESTNWCFNVSFTLNAISWHQCSSNGSPVIIYIYCCVHCTCLKIAANWHNYVGQEALKFYMNGTMLHDVREDCWCRHQLVNDVVHQPCVPFIWCS